MEIPEFPPSFLLLQQEGYLMSACLATGLTELGKAHVHNKGSFYSGLLNLTVGFERLLKTVIIIDHMLNNGLVAPSKKELQKRGHNINELYDECGRIAVNRNVPITARSRLDDIDQRLLNLLNDFAQVTRYHNLDALSASQSRNDPLSDWSSILFEILENDASDREKQKALAGASMMFELLKDTSTTISHGLDQRLLSVADAVVLPRLHLCAAKYSVFRMVKILSKLRDVLYELSGESYKLSIGVPVFPDMHEFLQWVSEDRSYALKKKRWP